MLLAESSLQAFQTASGVTAASLSLFIRVILLLGIFLWAAWCVPHFYKQAKQLDHLESLFDRLLRLLIVVSLVIAIVAV